MMERRCWPEKRRPPGRQPGRQPVAVFPTKKSKNDLVSGQFFWVFAPAAHTAFCERCFVASSQPTAIIINPPTISMVAAMKTAVSDGVIIQLLRMVRPQLSDVAP
jgi:hypothetical protein